MRDRNEDQSMRGGEKIMGRKRDNYQFTDLLYPPVDEIDPSVAMETNKGMSHEQQHQGEGVGTRLNEAQIIVKGTIKPVWGK